MSLVPPLPILGPGLGQIEPTVDERLAETAGIADKDAHLAILYPSRRAGILTPHADRVDALLQEAGLVDHQDAVLGAQRLHRVIADNIPQAIGRPGTAPQKRLHPIGALKTRLLRHQPAGLALDTGQKTLQEGTRRLLRLPTAKAWPSRLQVPHTT